MLVGVGQGLGHGGLALLAANRVEQLVLLVGQLPLDATAQAALGVGQGRVAPGHHLVIEIDRLGLGLWLDLDLDLGDLDHQVVARRDAA